MRPLWLRSRREPSPAPDERPAPPPPADPLVEAAAGGDGPAFRALFERHAPALRRFLRDLLQDEGAADEATQEAFVRAHARLSTLQESGRFGPWLFRIARHVALEELRERRGRPTDDDEALSGAPTELPSPEALLPRKRAGAGERAARHEARSHHLGRRAVRHRGDGHDSRRRRRAPPLRAPNRSPRAAANEDRDAALSPGA